LRAEKPGRLRKCDGRPVCGHTSSISRGIRYSLVVVFEIAVSNARIVVQPMMGADEKRSRLEL
jgi:hypothetical protein